jgi:hypothetical protein
MADTKLIALRRIQVARDDSNETRLIERGEEFSVDEPQTDRLLRVGAAAKASSKEGREAAKTAADDGPSENLEQPDEASSEPVDKKR